MIQRKSAGPEIFILSLIVGGAMIFATLLWPQSAPAYESAGLCLPGCSGWGIPRLWSTAASAILLGVLAISAQMLNKRYDFISGTDMVFPTVFFLLSASNPLVSATLSNSTLAASGVMAVLALMMGCYRSHGSSSRGPRNSTQEIFVAGTIASVGTMIDTAFIPIAIWCIPAWAMMRSLRIKEFLALALGLFAPWWCAIGTGLISPADIHLTPLTTFLQSNIETPKSAVIIYITAWWAFLAIIIGLNAAVKLYAGNSRVRAINNAFSVLGLIYILFMAVDFGNFSSYLVTFYLCVALQIAQLFALWPMPRARLWLSLILLLIAVQYPLVILL